MRTPETYNTHIDYVEQHSEFASVYGIKARSPLNGSTYFHVVSGLAPDIMHDLMEGVLPKFTQLVLKTFIEEGLSFDILNERIVSFVYGKADIKNKPTPLVKSNIIRDG